MTIPEDRRWGRLKALRQGAFLRESREKARLSTKEVALAVGMSLSQMCDLERGYVSLPLKRAPRFAEVLQIPTESVVLAILQDRLDEAGLSIKLSAERAG